MCLAIFCAAALPIVSCLLHISSARHDFPCCAVGSFLDVKPFGRIQASSLQVVILDGGRLGVGVLQLFYAILVPVDDEDISAEAKTTKKWKQIGTQPAFNT